VPKHLKGTIDYTPQKRGHSNALDRQRGELTAQVAHLRGEKGQGNEFSRARSRRTIGGGKHSCAECKRGEKRRLKEGKEKKTMLSTIRKAKLVRQKVLTIDVLLVWGGKECRNGGRFLGGGKKKLDTLVLSGRDYDPPDEVRVKEGGCCGIQKDREQREKKKGFWGRVLKRGKAASAFQQITVHTGEKASFTWAKGGKKGVT